MRPFPLLASALLPLLLLACGGSASSVEGAGGAGATASGATTSTSSSAQGGGGQGGGGECADPPDPGVFEVGTGELCFERLSAGQTIPVISGPQGGYHLWAAVLSPDCGPQTVISYATRDVVTHAELGWENSSVVAPFGPAGRVVGLQAPLPGAPWDPDNVLPKGTHVLLWVGERDAAGNLLREAEIEVVLGDEIYWDPCATDPDQCFG